ncbi:MAG: PA14 domain-containing protein [Polyangiaceae bacterium]|nr:PA14 domain-containing protein [Polyangiaceae bacterium]
MSRPLAALSLLLVAGCAAQFRASTDTNSSATGQGGQSPPPTPVNEGASDGKGSKWSGSFHKSVKASVKIDWQGRSGRLCRTQVPTKFVGIAHLAGTAKIGPDGASAKGAADASGKVSGGQSAATECAPPRTPVPPTVPPTPVREEVASKPATSEGTVLSRGQGKLPTKPQASKAPAPAPAPTATAAPPPAPTATVPPSPAPTATAAPSPAPTATATATPPPPPPPVPAAPPTVAELENPIEPPAEPPPNVFGYEKPVRGCFEGQVFPLAAKTKKLPKNWESLTPVSVVYACEWDIAPRAWDRGFPGIADRFEWFAIRYVGTFQIAEGGEYEFRLSSDDGAKLIIDGSQVVIDNDGVHPPKQARGKVQLSAGDHSLVLEYFQGPRYEINLQLWVTPPGKPEELFTVR